MLMPFGKYRDRPLNEIPDKYLFWLLSGDKGLDLELSEAARQELAERALCAMTRTLSECRTLDPKILDCARDFARSVRKLNLPRSLTGDLNRELSRLRGSKREIK